jgi:hypothetical protein
VNRAQGDGAGDPHSTPPRLVQRIGNPRDARRHTVRTGWCRCPRTMTGQAEPGAVPQPAPSLCPDRHEEGEAR